MDPAQEARFEAWQTRTADRRAAAAERAGSSNGSSVTFRSVVEDLLKREEEAAAVDRAAQDAFPSGTYRTSDTEDYLDSLAEGLRKVDRANQDPFNSTCCLLTTGIISAVVLIVGIVLLALSLSLSLGVPLIFISSALIAGGCLSGGFTLYKALKTN